MLCQDLENFPEESKGGEKKLSESPDAGRLRYDLSGKNSTGRKESDN